MGEDPVTRAVRASDPESTRRPWPDLLVVGVVNVALGVLGISWPGPTVAVVTVIFGVHLIICGAAGGRSRRCARAPMFLGLAS